MKKEKERGIKAKFNRNADYTLIFVLDAVGMILELVAARLMSPYFGNSNFVWTAIIGIILLAGSLGNLIGGRIASSKYPRYIAYILLLFASVYIAVTPLVDTVILNSVKELNTSTQFASVIGSIIFFLIPSTILGIITPIIMKEKIGDSEDKGKESGKITATIALGSLVGTFVGGFWLIPAMGTRMIFVIIAMIILTIAALLKPLKTIYDIKIRSATVIVKILVAIIVTVACFKVGLTNNNEVISIDTEYGRILVEDGFYNGQPVRFYKQSGAYSSATYTDDEFKYDLVFEYVASYDEMFKFLDVNDVAMIGGAAYQYPKYFISHFPNKTMDVVEIDPKSTEIAKQYFYLDDLLADYGTDRLGLYNDDGRLFMANGDKKYDAILNDAFSGEVPVAGLSTVEAVKTIKSRLNKDGVYMSNIIGALEGRKGAFLRAEVKTMQQVFKNVYVVPVYRHFETDQFINWMVIATDNDKYVPKKVVNVKINDEDIILTDDYNPVDSLVRTEYFD
ncbi:fused MFS/spermidine synthase [Candidatus Saccharibacteria bacterium]|nr:fused MFS/spermidine synthase [Candidatus Saccharibacteria bacterium]